MSHSSPVGILDYYVGVCCICVQSKQSLFCRFQNILTTTLHITNLFESGKLLLVILLLIPDLCRTFTIVTLDANPLWNGTFQNKPTSDKCDIIHYYCFLFCVIQINEKDCDRQYEALQRLNTDHNRKKVRKLKLMVVACNTKQGCLCTSPNFVQKKVSCSGDILCMGILTLTGVFLHSATSIVISVSSVTCLQTPPSPPPHLF